MKTICHKLVLLGILVLISKQGCSQKVDDSVNKYRPKKAAADAEHARQAQAAEAARQAQAAAADAELARQAQAGDPVIKDKPKEVEKDEGDEDEGDEDEDEDEGNKTTEADKKINQNFKNLDLDGNGYLSIKEIYQGRMKQNRDEDKKQLETYGNSLDMDGDGFINKVEYDGTEDEFDKIDANKNGFLTYNEFDIYYVQTQTKKFMDKYDVNHDKQLSLQEAKLSYDQK